MITASKAIRGLKFWAKVVLSRDSGTLLHFMKSKGNGIAKRAKTKPL